MMARTLLLLANDQTLAAAGGVALPPTVAAKTWGPPWDAVQDLGSALGCRSRLGVRPGAVSLKTAPLIWTSVRVGVAQPACGIAGDTRTLGVPFGRRLEDLSSPHRIYY
eukprot:TRINITY_DN222_c0_g1_i9.p4 TRINITY_DN222_c0_g1~~TRINITY_DN222_c0_g1_i9.p4  ORF type:complete len:109 (-),score=4.93 TRINITY_DN222_c0_g1_i9:582-908(-)